MGREAMCEVRIRGAHGLAQGPVRALLEATELILRGEPGRRYAVGALRGIEAVGDSLHFVHDADGRREEVALQLGARQAAAWAQKMRTPPPTLARKLGLDAEHRAYVFGRVDDAALAEALAGHRTRSAANAAVMVAVVRSDAELQAALAAHATLASPALWAVHPKGKGSTLPDATLRARLRAAGYRDHKTSAVSEALTATRWLRGP